MLGECRWISQASAELCTQRTNYHTFKGPWQPVPTEASARHRGEGWFRHRSEQFKVRPSVSEMNQLASHRLFSRTWNDTRSSLYLQPHLLPEIDTGNQERNVTLWLVSLGCHKPPSFLFSYFSLHLKRSFSKKYLYRNIFLSLGDGKCTYSWADTEVNTRDGDPFCVC